MPSKFLNFNQIHPSVGICKDWYLKLYGGADLDPPIIEIRYYKMSSKFLNFSQIYTFDGICKD